MAITGFMMWNPIATTRILPGAVVPAARAAHGAEALLAVLSIIVWHMYNVHIKRFNRSMFTGKMSRAAMEEEHGEELAAITQGEADLVLPPEIIARRKRRFWPYAVVMTIVLTAGLIWFVTFEETAITTVPRQDVVVFEPQVTLEAGDAAVGAAIWTTLRCARCHGDTARGGGDGGSLRPLEMDFDAFYTQVRNGIPDEMPGFSAGEIPDSYLLHLWTWLVQETDEASEAEATT
jgi:mono/diheme cytochrome c family protein